VFPAHVVGRLEHVAREGGRRSTPQRSAVGQQVGQVRPPPATSCADSGPSPAFRDDRAEVWPRAPPGKVRGILPVPGRWSLPVVVTVGLHPRPQHRVPDTSSGRHRSSTYDPAPAPAADGRAAHGRLGLAAPHPSAPAPTPTRPPTSCLCASRRSPPRSPDPLPACHRRQ
jgi:hypothetical protein